MKKIKNIIDAIRIGIEMKITMNKIAKEIESYH